jgi:hypothetical protein
MNKLTTIAALPQAGGCMSSLPPEVTTWEDLIFPTIDYESAEAEVVQMKAPYFQDEAQYIDERANRMLKAVQGRA